MDSTTTGLARAVRLLLEPLALGVLDMVLMLDEDPGVAVAKMPLSDMS